MASTTSLTLEIVSMGESVFKNSFDSPACMGVSTIPRATELGRIPFLAYTDANDRSHWIAWTDYDSLCAKPLSVTSQARELFTRARHVVIQSATIFDFTTFRRVLGISDTAMSFFAPSDFPVRNRPIIFQPAGTMSRTSMDKTIPNLCSEIEKIVDEFRPWKGVIHTHSYSINERVAHHLVRKYGNRIITHGPNLRSREMAIRQHFANGDASVLVSPCMTEGLDLRGDFARFQIVCKVPYPRLDAYTRARNTCDKSWYQLQTAWALVQIIGRAVRSNTDSATTFVLDSQFETFVSRNRGILPGWWLDAIQVSPKAA